MRIKLSFLIVCLFAAASAFAQQDPDDPGIQDSIIIGNVQVDSGASLVWVPVYFFADDSIIFFNLPISWQGQDGINPTRIESMYNCHYFSDTIMSFIRIVGFSDLGNDTIPCPRLFPDNHRIHFLSLGFTIEPNAPNQIVTLDTTWDDRNGSVMFGLADGLAEITPAVVPGSITYGLTGIEDNGDRLPGGFTLSQNNPNPFNAQTTISYSLPQSGPVTLSVYNIMGQKVATLVDGVQQAGEHKAVWDASAVTSGVYFGRLTSNSGKQNIKMMLLR